MTLLSAPSSLKQSRILAFFALIPVLFAWQINTGKAEEQKKAAVEYKAENLRDPFMGYLPKPKDLGTGPGKDREPVIAPPQIRPLPPLTIQGIIWGGKFPQAIINNKVVKTGDFIDEVKIIEINKEGITVSFDNRKYVLSVAEPEGRK